MRNVSLCDCAIALRMSFISQSRASFGALSTSLSVTCCGSAAAELVTCVVQDCAGLLLAARLATPATAPRLRARGIERELHVPLASASPSHEVLAADESDSESSSRIATNDFRIVV